LTRGYLPWRPDAVISTTRCETKYAIGVSRAVSGAPEQSQTNCLYQTLLLFSSQADSKEHKNVNKKRKLFLGPKPAYPTLFVLPLNVHVLVEEY